MRIELVPVLLAVALLVGCAALGPLDGASTPRAAAGPFEPKAILVTSMGRITIGLYAEMVPLTVQHFEAVAKSGAYDGALVSRIVKGYDVQVGGPTSVGRPDVAAIPDEFHPELRHDGPGVVSMATDGPDRGTSQFFITTAAVPSYDDRYAVFGHVIAGMPVVLAMSQAPIDGDTYGPPRTPITIDEVLIVPAPAPPAKAIVHGVDLDALPANSLVQPGANATFALLVANRGSVGDVVGLAATSPSGWQAMLEAKRVRLPAGRTWVVLLKAVPQPGAGNGTLHLTATSEADPTAQDSTDVTVQVGTWGPQATSGRAVTLAFTGMLEDGRIFDTTDAAVGAGPWPKMSSVFERTTYEPFSYTSGQGVIAGFDDLVQATHLGQTGVGRIPVGQGFVGTGANLLDQRALVFVVRPLSIQT